MAAHQPPTHPSPPAGAPIAHPPRPLKHGALRLRGCFPFAVQGRGRASRCTCDHILAWLDAAAASAALHSLRALEGVAEVPAVNPAPPQAPWARRARGEAPLIPAAGNVAWRQWLSAQTVLHAQPGVGRHANDGKAHRPRRWRRRCGSGWSWGDKQRQQPATGMPNAIPGALERTLGAFTHQQHP